VNLSTNPAAPADANEAEIDGYCQWRDTTAMTLSLTLRFNVCLKLPVWLCTIYIRTVCRLLRSHVIQSSPRSAISLRRRCADQRQQARCRRNVKGGQGPGTCGPAKQRNKRAASRTERRRRRAKNYKSDAGAMEPPRPGAKKPA